ncbi:tetratricopeptide repeat 1, partial [Brachionus plicatilis]
MSVKEENSDNEFYDACENLEKLSDDENFVSINPTENNQEEMTHETETKFVPLHQELNEKMNLTKENLKEEEEHKIPEIRQEDDPFFIDEDELKNEQLSEETKQERLNEALECKQSGNDLYKQNKFLEALEFYTKALRLCPLDFSKERSVFYSNRSLCFLKLQDNDRCIAECSKSLELDASFIKPLLRRAECYQLMDKLDESLVDYKKLAELEPKNSTYGSKIFELDEKIKERNEKMKEEMMGKLKDLGNMVLKPFGLSTENFQFVQDPGTGSYSVNFKKTLAKKKTMKLKDLIFLNCLILSLAYGSKVAALKPSEDYTFSLNVDDSDESQYKLYWKVLEKDEIQFEIHCRASGWIGFGLSPNGGMTGSDIAIGWVDSNGQAFLKDTHAIGKQAPIVDQLQNWNLIDASEKDGYTFLKIKRKLYTCDEENDFDIKLETQRLIFAWSDQDPNSETFDWSYHGPNRRIKSAVLLNFADETSDDETNSEITNSFEFRLDNHLIPAKDTYYLCQLFKLPALKTDLHLVSYEVLIEKESLSFVHHFDVYMCTSDDFEKVKNMSNIGFECGPGIDDESASQILKGICQARTMVFAWAVGGKRSISFPSNTGFRFTKSDKETVMVINYHFDNARIVS